MYSAISVLLLSDYKVHKEVVDILTAETSSDSPGANLKSNEFHRKILNLQRPEV